jgi:FolB domain-containing protein
MTPPDIIEIRRLQLSSRIGVPDAERATPQTLFVTLRMAPSQGFAGLADDISRTLDYARVAEEIELLALARPRCLLETLALEIADWLLTRHPVAWVGITLEKHILPNTECVAVQLERRR